MNMSVSSNTYVVVLIMLCILFQKNSVSSLYYAYKYVLYKHSNRISCIPQNLCM